MGGTTHCLEKNKYEKYIDIIRIRINMINVICIFDTQNTFHLTWKGLKNAFSLSLRLCLTATRPFCDRAAASSKEEW